MSNSYFQFKQFTIHQDRCAMKVTTDACLFGAWAAERIRRKESGAQNVLDIGTGTGLLSLMLAQKNPGIFIDSVEIEKDAFEQASSNIAASPWYDRVKVIYGDAAKFEFQYRYDAIVCNPPFYENDLKGDNLKKNIAHHNEGLLLPELLTIIKKNLKKDGNFYLLLPFKRKDELIKLLTKNGCAGRQMIYVKQSANHNYFRLLLEGKLNTDETTGIQTDEILIKDDLLKEQPIHYTAVFAKLLQDYYLHLPYQY